MGNNPPDDSLQRASECIVIANYLIERRRFEQALELLIEAIKLAPEHPIAYAKRALVCDEMGLSAQADADRQRVLQIASRPGSSLVRSSEGDAKAAMERARAALMGPPQPADAEPALAPPPSFGVGEPTAKTSEVPAPSEPPASVESPEVGASGPALTPSPTPGISEPTLKAAEVPVPSEPPAPVQSTDTGATGAAPPPSPSAPVASAPTAGTTDIPSPPEPPAPPESAVADGGDSKPRSVSPSAGLASTFFTVLMIGGAIAVVIGGIIFGISEFNDGGGSPALVIASPLADTSTPVQTSTPAPTATPVPTPVPTPLPSPAPISGVPFSLSSIQSGWDAAGFTITIRGESDKLSGFSIGGTDVSLAGPAGTGEFTVLVYADEEAPATDWDLVIGELPDPKLGRTLPEHNTIWWNSNIIAVVRTISGNITAALDALFQMTP